MAVYVVPCFFIKTKNSFHMKKSTLPTCLLAVFGWLISLPLFAQLPEKLCVTPTNTNSANVEACQTDPASPTPIPLNNRQGNFEVKVDRNQTHSVEGNGWYKAFWIFGDGNFRYFPKLSPRRMEDNLINSLNSNLPQYAATRLSEEQSYLTTYAYGINATNVKASVALTEIYSNDRPPEIGRIVVNPNSTEPTAPASSEIKTLGSNEEVSILTNHEARMGFTTMMVVSWTPNLKKGSARRLVIFYNGKKDGTNILPEVLNGDKVESFPPIYYNNPYPSINAAIPISDAASEFNRPPYNAEFTHYLLYDGIDNINQALLNPNFQERRMFFQFSTLDGLGGDQQEAEMAFRAVLFDADNGEIASKDYTTSIVASHDPNALIVEKIEDHGNGLFKVFFKMTICNDGFIPTPGFFWKLEHRPVAGNHFKRFALLGPAPVANPSNPDASPIDLEFRVPIGANPPNYSPPCKDVFFTLETDATGIAMLRNKDYDQLPFEACVRFSNNYRDEHCTRNIPIENQLKPVRPTDPPIGGLGDCILWLIFAGFALLGLVFYWFKKH